MLRNPAGLPEASCQKKNTAPAQRRAFIYQIERRSLGGIKGKTERERERKDMQMK